MGICLCEPTGSCSQNPPWHSSLIFLAQSLSWAAGIGTSNSFLIYPGEVKYSKTSQQPRATQVSLHGLEGGRSRELWQEGLPSASCSLPCSPQVLALCLYFLTCLSPEQDVWLNVTVQFLLSALGDVYKVQVYQTLSFNDISFSLFFHHLNPFIQNRHARRWHTGSGHGLQGQTFWVCTPALPLTACNPEQVI